MIKATWKGHKITFDGVLRVEGPSAPDVKADLAAGSSGYDPAEGGPFRAYDLTNPIHVLAILQSRRGVAIHEAVLPPRPPRSFPEPDWRDPQTLRDSIAADPPEWEDE